MIDQDKELPLGDIDQLDLEEDPRRYAARRKAQEIAKQQKQQQKTTSAKSAAKKGTANKSAGKKPPRSSSKAPTRKAPVAKSSTTKAVLIAVVVCFVLLLGLAGWSINRIDQLQAQLVAQQQTAAKQLQQLKGRILATGDTANKSRNQLSDTLASLHSTTAALKKTQGKQAKEQRRLAANDHQTRRRVGKLEDKSKALKTEVATLQDKLNEVAALQKTVKAQAKAQKVAAVTVSQLQMQQEINTDQVKQMTDDVTANQQQMKALKAAPAQLDKLQQQLDKVQSAITAFDKWRLQVNRQLRQASPAPAAQGQSNSG